ncbi:MAG: hypothetical protein NT062_33695, partial [Proteobacteria bacterium]|nr:hypothetical protein [Pseudomonadota bacterium]
GALFVSSIDPRTGRVLAQGPDELVLVRKHQAKVEVVLQGRDPIGRVIPGGPIVAGLADGRVMIADDGQPAREVVKVDGAVVGIGTDDQGYYTAIGQRGELVRGKIATGEIARIRVTPAPSMVVSSDGPRTPFALGDRLFLWADARTDELVKFESAVVTIGSLPHLEGLLVTLVDHGVYLVDPRTKRTQRVMPPLASPMIGSYDGSVLAGIERPSEISLVDLPGRARWSIPAPFQPLFLGDMSPSGKQMTTYVNGRSAIWTLPVIGTDLPAELARLTNATVDGDLLVWPWQHAVAAP